MSASLPFPSAAPYRVDQVMTAPLAMTGLFLVQLLLAGLISLFAQRGQRQGWWTCAAALLLTEVLFFTLASWGNSDTTKLSHYLATTLDWVRGEPLWMALAPLIVRLPWRMSLVHGLVAGGYAAMGLLLARHWRCPAWGGWWALLICCSPLLRNFLQNAVSRQALLTLLLVPALLWAGRLARLSLRGTVLSTLGAATVHTTFAGTLLLALLPRLLSGPSPLADLRAAGLGRSPLRTRLALLAALLLLLALAGFLMPTMLDKLALYVRTMSFANRYALSQPVQHLQLAMALGVLLAMWQRRLSPRALLACGHSRVLLLFALLFGLVQVSIALDWLPQITSRFSDALGLFLLVSWLAWLRRQGCLWAALPALLVTLQYWLADRLIASHALPCGLNDEFLCVPDRWPWQLRY
jgi:hypothetical protein